MIVGVVLGIVLPLLDAAGISESALSLSVLAIIGNAIVFLAAVAYIVSNRRGKQNLITENKSLTKRLNQIHDSLPNMELYQKPFVDIRDIKNTKSGELIGSPSFAHVVFCNNPKIRSEEATAKDIVAEIRFFDSEGTKQVLSMLLYGRWEGTEQPSRRDPYAPIRDLYIVDFEPNGLPRELDIALKYHNEDVCYAFNNQSYSALDWRKPDFVLHGERFQVNVKLKGKLVEKEWFFTLHNLGINQGLKIEVGKEAIDRQASLIG